MIKKLCDEIDSIIASEKTDYSFLRELIIEIIKNDKKFPEKFVDMVYDIHEADSFTTDDEKEAKNLNFYTPAEFVKFLKETKEKNGEFWK